MREKKPDLLHWVLIAIIAVLVIVMILDAQNSDSDFDPCRDLGDCEQPTEG